MKAEITVRITHTVNDTGIPPRTFSLQEVMRLDMPVEPEGFADSVESLLGGTRQKALEHLRRLRV